MLDSVDTLITNVLTLMNILYKKCPDIDEKLDKRDLALVKISDTGAGEEYGEEHL